MTMSEVRLTITERRSGKFSVIGRLTQVNLSQCIEDADPTIGAVFGFQNKRFFVTNTGTVFQFIEPVNEARNAGGGIWRAVEQDTLQVQIGL